ncbi:MAG: NAD-dependent epimerase/dehydratase family protein, partial [Thermoanaerobaculales bacterium]
MRILITGITGFVGPHLAEHIACSAPEAEIWGLVWGAEPGDAPPAVRRVAGDLTEISSLVAALDASRPDIVFHLAAASSVASSWDRPGRFLEVNAVGTVNLFEALRTLGIRPRIVISSSGEIYGPVPPSMQPITEEA